MNELVSVIMSVYNEQPRWLEESICSILEQTYSNIEFIIVLDNPTNNVLKDIIIEFSKQDDRIRLLINEYNMGLVASLNRALQHCHGGYIARMDADDISLPDRIEAQKAYLESNGLDFVFSGIIRIDENGFELSETDGRPISSQKVKKLLGISNLSNHPTWFLKKEVYDTLGGYRDVLYCEDYDFSLRSLDADFKIGKMDRNVLKYRVRSSSVSRSHSLEQFLNSNGIRKLYIRRALDDNEAISRLVRCSKRTATKTQVRRFDKASKLCSRGLQYIKDRKPVRGSLFLLGSALISRYNTEKQLRILRYKIANFSYPD